MDEWLGRLRRPQDRMPARAEDDQGLPVPDRSENWQQFSARCLTHRLLIKLYPVRSLERARYARYAWRRHYGRAP